MFENNFYIEEGFIVKNNPQKKLWLLTQIHTNSIIKKCNNFGHSVQKVKPKYYINSL